MNQEQLKPYSSNHFRCDNCHKEFYQTTAYSPDASLKITYCVNCVETEGEEICSFIDETNKKVCLNPLFDKKKQLCRSHNRQVRKRFNEFIKDKSIASSGAWEMSWEQSGDWKYFWNLGKEKAKTAENKPSKANSDWSKIKQKSLGEVPQQASQNLQAPELAPGDKRISGRTRQLNLKVKEQTYWQLKEFALKEKCLMTEVLEKALKCYDKHLKTK